jgi:hypothetical protein
LHEEETDPLSTADAARREGLKLIGNQQKLMVPRGGVWELRNSMGYGFQPGESIPLSYISYQAIFPTPPCRSRQWARSTVRVPVLSVVRFHREMNFGRDCRDNGRQYSVA